MINEYYIDGVIPHNGILKPEHSSKIISSHSEKERDDVSYDWSKECLRTVNLETKPNIITLGCSLTFGLGLPVEKVWPSILEKKLKNIGNYTVGNISYNGASTAKLVSSFFGMIRQFNYLPEYVICNFPNFERAYFPTPENIHGDIFWHKNTKKDSGKFPFKWETILPEQWIGLQSLDHIKMLETFCKFTGIKLIWSTWSVKAKNEIEDFLLDTFKYYHQDPTRDLFPPAIEFGSPTDRLEELEQYYAMYNWDTIKCHEKEKKLNLDCFEYAYDYHRNPVDYINPGEEPLCPHSGYHRQLHWAEFYFEKILNYDNFRD